MKWVRLWWGLRFRMVLLNFGVWFLTTALLWSTATKLVDRGYEQLERSEFDATIRRARGIVESRLQAVDMKAHDWAEWNDLAEWLVDGNPSFLAENISDSVLAILKERDHGFFRKDRSVAALYSYDVRTRRPLVPDTACMERVVAGLEDASLGLHLCGDSLELFSARPVRHALHPGERFGWIVIGHRIDKLEDAYFSSVLGKPTTIRISDSGDTVVLRDDSTALLSFDMPIVGSRSRARVRIEQERTIHFVAHRIRRSLSIVLIVGLLVGSVVSLFFFERLVILRILRLSGDVVAYGKASSSSSRIFGDGGGDEIGALGRAIDRLVLRLVGVQERLEDSLDAAQAGIRAKGAFLATMSHDLRTPLNGMIGLTEFLAKTRLDASQREAIELLRGGSENLLAMINDILTYSRSETGTIELLPEAVSTEKLFHQPVRILAPMAHRQGIDITLSFDLDLPSHLYVDSERVRQVLHNLVGNAVKFTEHGEVGLRVGALADGKVMVSVCDTGPGIPQAVIGTIFDPFVQVSAEDAKRRGGTGLGLAIAHKLVEQMGGRLEVRSVEGEGSDFSFAMDAPACAPGGPLVPRQFPWAGCDAVAVMVQRASLRGIVLDLVSHIGLEAVELPVPESALAVSESARMGALIADIESLGEESLTFLPIIRSHPAFADVPIVLLSRTDLLDDDGIRRHDSVQAILRRPVSPSQLVDALEKATRPRARILAHVSNQFLWTMVSGMLGNRGHHVEQVGVEEDESTQADVPWDVLLLDGDSQDLHGEWERLRRWHPGVTLVQLGGDTVLPGADRIERPFTSEALCQHVEGIAHRNRMCRKTARGV